MDNNNKDTKNQIDQMTQFIINEAKDRAEEITTKTLQEFSVEKLKVINSTKQKILQDFARKSQQRETLKAIERSTEINKSRLEKVKTRQEMLLRLADDSKAELEKVLKDKGKSKDFTTKIIVQGLLMLLEDEVKVRCRESDVDLVKSCLDEAVDQYSKVVKEKTGAEKTCKLVLDEDVKLPPAPGQGQHGASCLGGVVLACQNGAITIDNTIDSRLRLVLEQAKPTIRAKLFQR